MEDHFAPASRQLESAREQIDRLAAEWKAATMFVSSTTQMCTHPAYQRIIGMGPEAIPLLLERLDQKPDHWFWALHAITGVNPTGPADAGDIERMSDAWLRWGREHGYIS
ncbi:MAG: hypothetical protein GY778_30600 [bacterium]|nr:hypothetical protein [bacterium]